MRVVAGRLTPHVALKHKYLLRSAHDVYVIPSQEHSVHVLIVVSLVYAYGLFKRKT